MPDPAHPHQYQLVLPDTPAQSSAAFSRSGDSYKSNWLLFLRRPAVRILLLAALLLGLLHAVTSTFSLAQVQQASASLDRQDGPPSIRVAVEERAGHHSEVWPSFVHTLSRLENVDTSVYLTGGSAGPARNGIARLIAPFFPAAAHKIHDWGEVLPALANEADDERIDVVISTTCHVTILERGEDLLRIYDEREHKFMLVCVIHHADKSQFLKQQAALDPWIARNSIVLVGLSDHTSISTTACLTSLKPNATYLEPPDYTTVPVKTLVPIFPLSKDTLGVEASIGRRINSAVIQGTISHWRRDYKKILKSLIKHIEADPELWGWTLHANDEPYTAAMGAGNGFTLKLIGHLAEKPSFIPRKLANVVKIMSDLNYLDFYREIHASQLLIPAFSNDAYYKSSASSSIAAAVVARTPVLATARHLRSYTCLDNRSIVLQSDSLDPIATIAQFRRNEPIDPHQQSNAEAADASRWPKSPDAFARMAEAIYAQNDQVMLDILRSPSPHGLAAR